MPWTLTPPLFAREVEGKGGNGERVMKRREEEKEEEGEAVKGTVGRYREGRR